MPLLLCCLLPSHERIDQPLDPLSMTCTAAHARHPQCLMTGSLMFERIWSQAGSTSAAAGAERASLCCCAAPPPTILKHTHSNQGLLCACHRLTLHKGRALQGYPYGWLLTQIHLPVHLLAGDARSDLAHGQRSLRMLYNFTSIPSQMYTPVLPQTCFYERHQANHLPEDKHSSLALGWLMPHAFAAYLQPPKER